MIGIPIVNRIELLIRGLTHIDVDDRIVLIINSRDAKVLRELDNLAKRDRRLELLPQDRNIEVAASWKEDSLSTQCNLSLWCVPCIGRRSVAEHQCFLTQWN